MLLQELSIKLALCILLGGAIGAERELRSKSAGFRTIILICMGATLFTIISEHLGADAGRVAANVVVGIGFVGAGVIFRGDNSVTGITTAATIWVTAGVGMLIGSGYYIAAALAGSTIVAILFLFSYIERGMDRLNQIRNYRLVYKFAFYRTGAVVGVLEKYGLRLRTEHYVKAGDNITGTCRVQGTASQHKAFIAHMLEDVEVQDFEW